MSSSPANACNPGCICKGNWRVLVAEAEPLLDKRFLDDKGLEFRFFGLVHGRDDYYYGMSPASGGSPLLLSCVCSLEGQGFRPVVAA